MFTELNFKYEFLISQQKNLQKNNFNNFFTDIFSARENIFEIMCSLSVICKINKNIASEKL